MIEKRVLIPENGDDIVSLLEGIRDFVEDSPVSYGNVDNITELCLEIIREVSGSIEYI